MSPQGGGPLESVACEPQHSLGEGELRQMAEQELGQRAVGLCPVEGTAVSVGSFLQMGETRILGVGGGENGSPPPTQRRKCLGALGTCRKCFPG